MADTKTYTKLQDTSQIHVRGVRGALALVQTLADEVLAEHGIQLVKTNGVHEVSRQDADAINDILNKLKLKIQINSDVAPDTPYKVLIKNNADGHVYVQDPVLTLKEKDDIKNSLSLKVQITGEKADIDDHYQVLAKNKEDGHVYLCPVTITLREKQDLATKATAAYAHITASETKITSIEGQIASLKSTLDLLHGAIPSSVQNEITKIIDRLNHLPSSSPDDPTPVQISEAIVKLAAQVQKLTTNQNDFVKIASGNGAGNYQFVVMNADGTIHATTDFDEQQMIKLVNDMITVKDKVDTLSNARLGHGYIANFGIRHGSHAADITLFPLERLDHTTLRDGDRVTLQYPIPTAPGTPGKSYWQDFIYVQGTWRAVGKE